jgi:hypothetical protein
MPGRDHHLHDRRVFRHQDSNGGGGLITDGDPVEDRGGRIVISSLRPPDQHCLVRLSLITLRSTLEIQLRRAVHHGCVRSRPGPARR